MHMYLTSTFILSYLWQLMHTCLADIFFSLFMPMTLEIVYTFLSIQNTNAYKVLGDSHKYFTVVSHICAFISMIP